MLPFHMAVCLAKDVCRSYRHISRLKATRYALFSCTNPKDAFMKVAASLAEEDKLATLHCLEGHSFLKVCMTMAGALFNAFTSNYTKEVNSEIHSKQKRGCPGVSAAHSQNLQAEKAYRSEEII